MFSRLFLCIFIYFIQNVFITVDAAFSIKAENLELIVLDPKESFGIVQQNELETLFLQEFKNVKVQVFSPYDTLQQNCGQESYYQTKDKSDFTHNYPVYKNLKLSFVFQNLEECLKIEKFNWETTQPNSSTLRLLAFYTTGVPAVQEDTDEQFPKALRISQLTKLFKEKQINVIGVTDHDDLKFKVWAGFTVALKEEIFTIFQFKVSFSNSIFKAFTELKARNLAVDQANYSNYAYTVNKYIGYNENVAEYTARFTFDFMWIKTSISKSGDMANFAKDLTQRAYLDLFFFLFSIRYSYPTILFVQVGERRRKLFYGWSRPNTRTVNNWIQKTPKEFSETVCQFDQTYVELLESVIRGWPERELRQGVAPVTVIIYESPKVIQNIGKTPDWDRFIKRTNAYILHIGSIIEKKNFNYNEKLITIKNYPDEPKLHQNTRVTEVLMNVVLELDNFFTSPIAKQELKYYKRFKTKKLDYRLCFSFIVEHNQAHTKDILAEKLLSPHNTRFKKLVSTYIKGVQPIWIAKEMLQYQDSYKSYMTPEYWYKWTDNFYIPKTKYHGGRPDFMTGFLVFKQEHYSGLSNKNRDRSMMVFLSEGEVGIDSYGHRLSDDWAYTDLWTYDVISLSHEHVKAQTQNKIRWDIVGNDHNLKFHGGIQAEDPIDLILMDEVLSLL